MLTETTLFNTGLVRRRNNGISLINGGPAGMRTLVGANTLNVYLIYGSSDRRDSDHIGYASTRYRKAGTNKYGDYFFRMIISGSSGAGCAKNSPNGTSPVFSNSWAPSGPAAQYIVDSGPIVYSLLAPSLTTPLP